MDVQFENLSFTVGRFKTKRKCLLKGVSGIFRTGEFSAILGPSGAGKTTLLNALSGYRSSEVKGELKLNGEPRIESRFRRLSCYIMQEDSLQPFLTLHELMLHVASLKLPLHYNQKQRNTIVDEIITSFRLEDCRDQTSDSLSGGQRKRLCVALELVNNPPIIFLDEPTSGLDNVSASGMLKLLRDLAHAGRTVVCTIHQPSASQFNHFDKVYFVASGRCVYQGSPDRLVPFLASVGLRCPTTYNPADYVIEMADESENFSRTLSNAIQNGKQEIFSDKETDKSVSPQGFNFGPLGVDMNLYNEESSFIKTVCTEFNKSCWFQFYALFCRMLLQIRRNKVSLKIQLFHHVGCGLAVSLMFWGLAQSGDEFFNQMKFTIGVTVFHAYTYAMVTILGHPFDVKLVKKENFNQWYGCWPYFLALTLSKMPAMIFFSTIFCSMVYYASGLPLELFRFVLFCFANIIVAATAEGMGIAIGSIFSVTNGTAVGPMSIAPLLGLAIYGFDFAKQIPWYWQALMRTSFLRSGVVCNIMVMFGLNRGPLDCPHDSFCFFKNPKSTLHYLDMHNNSIFFEFFWLISMYVFFRVLGLIAIVYRFRT